MKLSIGGLFQALAKGLQKLEDHFGPYYSPDNPEPAVRRALEDKGYKFKMYVLPPQPVMVPVALPPIYSIISPKGERVAYGRNDQGSQQYRADYDSAAATYGTAPKPAAAPAP